jgi:hypothetical protein
MAQDRLTAIGEFAECLDQSPDLESSLGQAHHDAERAAGEFLAVATVAYTGTSLLAFPAHSAWWRVEAAMAARDVPAGESLAFRESCVHEVQQIGHGRRTG